MKEDILICAYAALTDPLGRILILKRPSTDKTYPGHWDLPGDVVRHGEIGAQTAERAVREQTGLGAKDFEEISHQQDEWIDVQIWRAEMSGSGSIRLRNHTEHRWVHPDDLKNLPLTDTAQALVNVNR